MPVSVGVACTCVSTTPWRVCRLASPLRIATARSWTTHGSPTSSNSSTKAVQTAQLVAAACQGAIPSRDAKMGEEIPERAEEDAAALSTPAEGEDGEECFNKAVEKARDQNRIHLVFATIHRIRRGERSLVLLRWARFRRRRPKLLRRRTMYSSTGSNVSR